MIGQLIKRACWLAISAALWKLFTIVITAFTDCVYSLYLYLGVECGPTWYQIAWYGYAVVFIATVAKNRNHIHPAIIGFLKTCVLSVYWTLLGIAGFLLAIIFYTLHRHFGFDPLFVFTVPEEPEGPSN